MTPSTPPSEAPYLVVLGTAQDAGLPQAGCTGSCCERARVDPTRRRHVACLAIVDPAAGRRWMIDATPDFREQLAMLDTVAPVRSPAPGLDGLFLTHGHVGHYVGLIFVGPESIGTRRMPTYVMPRMRDFLASNGPWDQLVRLDNIELRDMAAGHAVRLSDHIAVTPIVVPHRDEYTETVGFRIDGPGRSALWVPDIDTWGKWDRSIAELLADVDVAWLDGTFYAAEELPGRDLASIPHPFIVETVRTLGDCPPEVRERVRFIHLNHSNPAHDESSDARREIEAAGHHVATELERFDLGVGSR